jgi:hypothetical protein
MKLLRESVNAGEIARAVFPQGVSDLPVGPLASQSKPVS